MSDVAERREGERGGPKAARHAEWAAAPSGSLTRAAVGKVGAPSTLVLGPFEAAFRRSRECGVGSGWARREGARFEENQPPPPPKRTKTVALDLQPKSKRPGPSRPVQWNAARAERARRGERAAAGVERGRSGEKRRAASGERGEIGKGGGGTARAVETSG